MSAPQEHASSTPQVHTTNCSTELSSSVFLVPRHSSQTKHIPDSQPAMGSGVKLSEISDFISCPICQGFLVDATTVSECLHSFCRTCIVRHIKNNNNECPKCNITIHERRPLDYIIYDRSKQDIVYKLVPQLYASERRRDEQVQSASNETPPTNPLNHHRRRRQPSALSLQVILKPLKEPIPIYLKCPLKIMGRQLRKLLIAKYQLTARHKVTLLYKGDQISDDDQISNLAPSLRFCIHYEIT